MNRRDFLNQTKHLGFVGAATALSGLSMASAQQATEDASLVSEISNNHGHSVDLTLGQTIQLFRQTLVGGPESINIQGQSRHPHEISLSAKDLLNLIIGTKLEIESNQEAGHTHLVTLQMVIA